MADQFRFGDCELRLANRELLRQGATEEIQSRAFDVLSYLVTHADRLVGKDELLDQVWGHRVVSESALTRTVMKVRKAIGDDAHSPRFIVTHHGHGYRFVGDVEAINGSPQVISVTSETAEPAPPAHPSDQEPVPPLEPGAESHKLVAQTHGSMVRRLRVPLAMALVLAVGLGLGAWMWVKAHDAGPAAPPRLAVLPVANATGDPSMEWVRLGLMSLMGDSIGAMGRVDLVPVAETLGAVRVVGNGHANDPMTAKQAVQVGKVLKAKMVVQGRLQRDGIRYELRVDLYDASGQKITRTFHGSDPVALATDAGHDIARFVMPSPAPAISGQQVKKLSLDPYINETYVRALAEKAHGHFESASHLLDVVIEAVKDQPEAAQLEPMLQLAATLEKTGSHRKAMKLATEARDIAQRQDDPGSLARAYHVMSMATEKLGDMDTADTYARKELALASADHPSIAPNAQMRLGALAFGRSRYDEAERWTRAAIVGYRQMGSDFHLAGGYLELGAIEQTTNVVSAVLHNKRALALARGSGRTDVEVGALINLGYAQRKLGDCPQALQYLDKALTLAGNTGNRRQEARAHIWRAECLAAQGHVDDAIEEMRAAQKLASALGEPGLEATTLLQYANMLSQSNKHSRQETEELYKQAAGKFEAAGQLGQASGSLLNAAQQMVHDRQFDEAGRTLARSEALAQQTQNQNLIAGIMVVRAELDYRRGDKQRALESMQKARSRSSHRSKVWVNTSASIIWLELDLHHPAKAAAIYAQTVGVDDSYVALCIVSARLLYAQRQFADALKKQQTCLTHLGTRVSDVDRDIRDAYRAASRSGKYVALPDKPPPMLWL